MTRQQTPDALAATYDRDGYVFPVDVLDAAQAAWCRSEFESLERQARDESAGHGFLRQNTHYVAPFVNDIVRHPTVLEAVSAILGQDLLVWASSIFLKEACTEDFVSWHQDLHYWGLDSTEEVTVWLALSPATIESGCMRFIPGTHRTEDLAHADTFSDANLLSRGQVLCADFDESRAVDVVLAPGQASLHHGRMFHASNPNRSDDRRIGLAVRYISPRMRQVASDHDFAMLVKGEDRYGHFELVSPPTGTLVPDEVARWQIAADAKKRYLYRGATEVPA